MKESESYFFVLCINLLLISALSASLTGSGFLRDVVRGSRKEDDIPPTEIVMERMHADLMSKAVPLSEYNDGILFKQRRNEENYENFYSLSGFSVKYSKCQTVQKFSDAAMENGGSPMISEDIVILRLCPYKTCSKNRQYGCHYNYAEYALTVQDYVSIMLNYAEEKSEKRCEWCRDCNERRGRRKLEDGENDAEDGDDNANGYNGRYYNYNGNYYYDENDECYIYGSYCDEDTYYACNENSDDDFYVKANEYIDYIDCGLVENDYGEEYYVRPRCDASDGTIKMGVYYNEFCSNYAGDSVSINSLQVHFKDDIFEEFYEGSCIDCSSSYYPPDFNSNSNLCNMVHSQSAQCVSNLEYDLFDVGGQSINDTTACAYIESIRFGTYNEDGEISSKSYADGAQEQVTLLQQIGLLASATLCGVLVVYSCYLHHSMTNLLIKSLSHRELLPPSRHSKRRTTGSSPRRVKKVVSGKRHNDDDWPSPTSDMSS